MAAGLARLLRALHPSPIPVAFRALSRSVPAMAPEPEAARSGPEAEAELTRKFRTLRLQRPRERVLHVELNRPEKRNAINLQCWRELVECFQAIAQDPWCRAVLVSGAGSAFTAGIDLSDLGSAFLGSPDADVARRAWSLRQKILEFQESFSVMERCPKPVIAAVHGPCIGAGVDLISACDIRLCSQDASFQVKEVDMGLAADVGTLQRLPKIIGNQSLVNELAFTARVMRAPEALSCGLVRPRGTWPCCRPRTSPSRFRPRWTRRDPRMSPSPSSDVTSVPPECHQSVTSVTSVPPECHQSATRVPPEQPVSPVPAVVSPQCHLSATSVPCPSSGVTSVPPVSPAPALVSPQCHQCPLPQLWCHLSVTSVPPECHQCHLSVTRVSPVSPQCLQSHQSHQCPLPPALVSPQCHLSVPCPSSGVTSVPPQCHQCPLPELWCHLSVTSVPPQCHQCPLSQLWCHLSVTSVSPVSPS